MREALSGALNRFVANPSLKPETGIINELGISYKEDNFKTKLTGFYNLYDNLIVQIRLTKAQDPDRRRQRVNLQKADVMGLEWTNEYKYKDLGLRFNLTYMNTDVNFSSDTSSFDKIRLDTLDNRPSLLSGLVVNYSVTDAFTPQLEVDYVGESYQVDSDGYYQTIKGNPLLNLRLNYNFQIDDSQLLDVFIRVNNLFDTFRESQLGIIETGRSVNLGLTYKI
jgi:outer membrane receptor for ferrienterochelin and colicin